MNERLHGTRNLKRCMSAKRKRGLRAEVQHRDRGVCAACGRDTEALIAAQMKQAGQSREDAIAAICWDWGVNSNMGSRSRQEFRHSLWIADHIVPLALGGRDVLGNIQTLCLECNLSKTIKDIGDALRSRHKARRIVGKMGARAMHMRKMREEQFIQDTDRELGEVE